MNYVILNEKELDEATVQLPQWKYAPDIPAICAEFHFDTFMQAMQFMHTASTYIDKINHHPQWTNIYNRIMITLCTHDVKAITTLDIQLAKYLTDLYKNI